MDTLENECEQSVKRAHELIISNSQEKLLGVSIIERLKNTYGANHQELRTFISDLVKFAGNYVSFSNMEKGKSGQGIPGSPNCITEFTAILPKASQHADFMETLKQTLKQSRSDRVNLIETESRANEITLISISNLFPLRFLGPLANLKDKYDLRLKAIGTQRGTLELHIEGDGSNLHGLYSMSTGEIVEAGIPYFLLAKAADIVVKRKNQTTGTDVLSLITKDEDGFDNEPLDLGASLPDILEKIDEKQFNRIREEVVRLLNEKEYLHVDRQKELISKINTDIDDLKAELGMDNDIYKNFLKGAKAAAKIIKARN